MAARLAGKPYEIAIPFTLEQFRALVTECIEKPCSYCGEIVVAKNFSADHATPLNRADEVVPVELLAALGNIRICCDSCQKLKGAMSAGEYGAFLVWLGNIDITARRDVTRRLKAGGAVIRCGIAKR